MQIIPVAPQRMYSLVPVYLGTFIAGLVLAVVAMFHGVGRVRGSFPTRFAPGTRYPAALWLPALAGFLAAFGAMGYLLRDVVALGMGGRVVAATLAGLACAAGAVMLVTRWAIPAELADEVDERFVLMGQFAQVIEEVRVDAPGRVTYEVDGTVHTAPARAFGGGAIAAGTDVVIERIEDGTAFVEPWVVVEQRI